MSRTAGQVSLSPPSSFLCPPPSSLPPFLSLKSINRKKCFLKNKLIEEGGQWWQGDQLGNCCSNQVRENGGLEVVEKCLDPRSILKEQSAG